MIDIKEASEKIKGFKAGIPEYGPNLEKVKEAVIKNFFGTSGRITVDKPESFMETIRNKAYLKDGNVWIRGLNSNEGVSLYDYIRANSPDWANQSDEEINIDMCDACIDEDLTVMVYWLATGFAEIREWLKDFEDAKAARKQNSTEALVDFMAENSAEIEYALAHQDRDLLEEVIRRFAEPEQLGLGAENE